MQMQHFSRLAQRLVLIALALGLAAPLAHAQWKWRDKDGRVTVSDIPPPRDVADKDILARPNVEVRRTTAAPAPTASAPAAPAAPTALEREVQARKKADEEAKAAKAKAEEEKQAAQRAENCKAARSNIASLESGIRIVRTNDKGEREVLEDAARAEELRRAKAVAASECR